MNFIDRFRDLVGSAERANVTFYPVDVGGLRGDLRRPRRSGRLPAPPTDTPR